MHLENNRTYMCEIVCILSTGKACCTGHRPLAITLQHLPPHPGLLGTESGEYKCVAVKRNVMLSVHPQRNCSSSRAPSQWKWGSLPRWAGGGLGQVQAAFES